MMPQSESIHTALFRGGSTGIHPRVLADKDYRSILKTAPYARCDYNNDTR